MGLSEHEERILKLVAAGHSYDQILASTPGSSYMDIFQAAQSALDEINSPSYSVDEVRRRHPNAYRPWSESEDEELRRRARQSEDPQAIARALGRSRGAVESRLVKVFIREASTA